MNDLEMLQYIFGYLKSIMRYSDSVTHVDVKPIRALHDDISVWINEGVEP